MELFVRTDFREILLKHARHHPPIQAGAAQHLIVPAQDQHWRLRAAESAAAKRPLREIDYHQSIAFEVS